MTFILEYQENLFLPHISGKNDREVLIKVASNLQQKKIVKDGYVDAILQREQKYPTGLPVGNIGVAVPHADYKLVNKATLSVATLTEPIIFHNMGDVKATLPVQIIIMMAIKEPHSQVKVLQRLMEIIQDESFRKDMVDADTPAKLKNLFLDKLLVKV